MRDLAMKSRLRGVGFRRPALQRQDAKTRRDGLPPRISYPRSPTHHHQAKSPPESDPPTCSCEDAIHCRNVQSAVFCLLGIDVCFPVPALPRSSKALLSAADGRLESSSLRDSISAKRMGGPLGRRASQEQGIGRRQPYKERQRGQVLGSLQLVAVDGAPRVPLQHRCTEERGRSTAPAES